MYQYDIRPFTQISRKRIDAAIKDGVDDKILDILTRTHNNRAVFKYGEIVEIIHGAKNGLTAAEIEIFTKLNSNYEPVFDESMMRVIAKGLNSKTLSRNHIDTITKLDKNEKPIFNDYQVLFLIDLIKEYNVPDNLFNMFSKQNNDKAVFSYFEMEAILSFIRQESTTDKQKQQIENLINKGLEYKYFASLIKNNESADIMRIYSSLYETIPNKDYVMELTDKRIDYEELKVYKYLFQCIKDLEFGLEMFTNKSIDTVFDIEQALVDEICHKYGINADDTKNFIYKITFFAMPADQIDLIASLYPYIGKMKLTATAILEGLSIDEIKDTLNKKSTDQDIKEDFKNKINKKIIQNTAADEVYTFNTDEYFGKEER